MQIVEAIADSKVRDRDGRPAYELRRGEQYVVHDEEAGAGLRDQALKLVAAVDRTVPLYRREPLSTERIILPFIGRLGDAVIAASCVAALVEAYPEVTVDVAGRPAARQVWQLMPTVGKLLPYPITAEQLSAYQYYMSFENIEAVAGGPQKSAADLFSKCLGTPRPSQPARPVVPADARNRWALTLAGQPRAAVHVGRIASLKAYPPDLHNDLVELLVENSFEVFEVGESEQTGSAGRTGSPHVHHLAGRTPTAADLGALLMQMQVVITGDSFPLHLAGALGVPVVAMFTSTDAGFAADYPTVTAVQSLRPCSPCNLAEGRCPAGLAGCPAHRADNLRPAQIVEQAMRASTTAATSGSSR